MAVVTPLTPAWLKQNYLGYVPTTYPDGTAIPDEAYQEQIDSAVEWVGNQIGSLALTAETITHEKHDILQNGQGYPNFAPLRLRRKPVRTVTEVLCAWGTQELVSIPLTWVNKSKDGLDFGGLITILPNGNAQAVYTTTGLPYPFAPYTKMPLWWRVSYTAGFETVGDIPKELLACIGMQASLQFYESLAPLLGGAAGVSSRSKGLDGLSTSVGFDTNIYLKVMEAREKRLGRDIQTAMTKYRRVPVGFL